MSGCCSNSASDRSTRARGTRTAAGSRPGRAAGAVGESRHRRGARRGARHDRGQYERVMSSACAVARPGAGCRPRSAASRAARGRRAAAPQVGARQPRHPGDGKIKAEGDASAGDDRHRDFAVGQSRMLYGLSMHPNAQTTACSSSGIRSAWWRDQRLQLPVAVWPGTRSCRDLRQRHGLEAVAQDSAVRRGRAEALQPGARAARASGIFQLFVDAGHELATRFVDDRRVALVSSPLDAGRPRGRRAVARRSAGAC